MIKSLNHPQIKLLKMLHTKKWRNHHKQFLAEGMRVCKTLIESGAALVTLYVTPEHKRHADQLCKTEQITIVTQEVADAISFSTTASGVVGLFNIPESTKPTIISHGIVLDEISDPGNMGTLLRTAAAMNIKDVLVIGGADIWAPKVIQASAGTIGLLQIYHVTWEETIELARNNNVILSALVVKNGMDPLLVNKDVKRLLIVGNEAHGISDAWINKCQEKLTLVMPGNIESLNAAIAGSIALYLLFNR